MRHEPSTRRDRRSRVGRGQTAWAAAPTARPAVNPLLRRQITDSVQAQQRFTQRHEALLHGPPTDCDRQGLLDLLAIYTSLIDSLENQCGDLVVLARQQGVSWAQIAIMLGVSRQAAQQRYQPALDRAARTAARQAELASSS